MTWTPDEDWEPDAEDSPEDDGETVPCPHCRRPIYEDSQQCPHCRNFITNEESPPRRRPAWFVITAIVCLVFVVLWIFNR